LNVARDLKIPSKNICRWRKGGIIRKQGQGRKKMEEGLEEKLK